MLVQTPVGHNKLKNFVSQMCEEAGIVGYKTNHSLRATAATRLYASGVDEQLVMEELAIVALKECEVTREPPQNSSKMFLTYFKTLNGLVPILGLFLFKTSLPLLPCQQARLHHKL